jgi:hypothetical protein
MSWRGIVSGVQRIWYVAYGSNLSRTRFECYLTGGTPDGGGRPNPGARDSRSPSAVTGVTIPGRIWFAGKSSVWGGGMAFYDRAGSGSVLARAYLLTVDQFADVVAQELRQLPGESLDLTPVFTRGRHSYGPKGYETLLRLGTRLGLPMVTFTCNSERRRLPNAPSASYLRTMAVGLREAHGLSAEAVATYVCALPGVGDAWTRAEVAKLAA